MNIYLDNYKNQNQIVLSGEMSATRLKEKIMQTEMFLEKKVIKVVINFGIDGGWLNSTNSNYGIDIRDIEIDLEGIKNKWIQVKNQNYRVAFIENEKYFITLHIE